MLIISEALHEEDSLASAQRVGRRRLIKTCPGRSLLNDQSRGPDSAESLPAKERRGRGGELEESCGGPAIREGLTVDSGEGRK